MTFSYAVDTALLQMFVQSSSTVLFTFEEHISINIFMTVHNVKETDLYALLLSPLIYKLLLKYTKLKVESIFVLLYTMLTAREKGACLCAITPKLPYHKRYHFALNIIGVLFAFETLMPLF